VIKLRSEFNVLEQMNKLEDLSKENIFKVPDGYFERLPGVIQSRVAKPEPKSWFVPSFRLALPVVALAIAVTVWFTSRQGVSLEDQLNEIQTEQLMTYLEESDLSTDVLTEEISWSDEDLNELEEKVISSMEPIDIMLEDLSVEPDNFK
jgi:hypothetical protein